MNTGKIGILWDVDGTLVDTAEQHFLAWEQLSTEIGHPFTRADFARTFGWRNPEIIRTLYDANADDAKCERLALRKETLYRDSVMSGGTKLLPGVKALLDAFEAEGWPQAVGSSAPRENLNLLLGATGTRDYFPTIVCGEDVTRGKPDPEVFLKGAAGLGIAPTRCVVFEDAVAGVQAAKAGGMACIAVTFVGHHPAEKLREAGAGLVVATLEEVTVEVVQRLVG
ncbi:HAD family hydrolase [Limnoglobus roseus]|uniref:HAD family phosphatase n=1 Tax=Limnoglobus roseus TaxID=2598579 RepID=A0A5C1A7V7_9BACT|nr:HAD family phosphatase [Limnoglobus roseus]QEL15399.1 HAD family phosphatase [Limnoglobus roseus]